MHITLTKIQDIDNYISYSIDCSEIIVNIDCDTGVTVFTVSPNRYINSKLIFNVCDRLIQQWKINTTLPNTLSWNI